MTGPTLIAVVATLVVASWAAMCVRRVPAGEWVAVARGGVVRRVRRSGLAWRLPFVEDFLQDADVPQEVPIHVRATTRDGVPVVVLAEATVSLPRPVVGTRYADPWPAAELAAEDMIARTVTDWSVAELARTAGETASPLLREVGLAADVHGVQVDDLALLEVDVPLHGPS